MSNQAADLAAFYDRESAARANRPVDPQRVERRAAFAQLLRDEARTAVVDLGSGPGRDATALAADGLRVTCVDLSAANAEQCAAAGLEAHVASMLELPFATATFDAAWTMSTLIHLHDVELDVALAEIARVVRPGAPVAVGTWSSLSAAIAPTADPRFFRFRSDDELAEALARHGAVERLDTWRPEHDPDRTYQWALLRTAPDHS